jgi:hypothetical protein
MTKEHMDASDAFYSTWAPNAMHNITFWCHLDKVQKKCKSINVIISDDA